MRYSSVFPTSDAVNIATRKGQVVRETFILLEVFDYKIWIGILISLFTLSLVMLRVSQEEEKLLNARLRHWSNYANSLWYVFSTLIGESITRDTKSSGAWSLR